MKIKVTVESLKGYCQVNPRDGRNAPLVLAKKGDKKVFETHGEFLPYAEGVHSQVLAGNLKVVNEDLSLPAKAAPVKAKEEKVESKSEEKKEEKKDSKSVEAKK